MKAVVYQAPFSIAAENVPDPELQHVYEGRTATLPSNASRPRR